MTRLMLVIYSMASVSLAGMAIVAVLTMGYFTGKAIIASAVLGAVVAIPVSMMIAKRLA